MRDAAARGDTLEGSGGVQSWVRHKPFAVWVVFGGLVYFGLAILALALPVLVASPAARGDPLILSVLVFTALFFVSGAAALKGRRWTFVLAAVVSILFLVLFGPFFVPSLSNPADSAFWLALSGIPALIFVALFSILSLKNAKAGLLHKRYLATPQSTGGLFTIAIVGFVVGGLSQAASGPVSSSGTSQTSERTSGSCRMLPLLRFRTTLRRFTSRWEVRSLGLTRTRRLTR